MRAVVQLIKTGKRAKFLQTDLETVIPQAGREVVIMKGEFAKRTGILAEIKQSEFRVLVKVKLSDDEEIEALFKFDEISKKHEKKKKVSQSAEPIPEPPV